MSRLHIHISVDTLDPSIQFYSALFGSEPSVLKEDYAKWDLQEPAVNFAISARGKKTGLDHVGIQTESEEELAAVQARLDAAGISGISQDGTCCYASSQKYWSIDPQGIAWEGFHTLDSIPTFNDADTQAPENSCCVPDSAASCCS